MDINTLIQSKYLKASELQGKEVTVTIAKTDTQTMQDGQHKLCVYFQGKEKGLLLNITNMRAIAAMHGNDTDNWPGKKIMLVSAYVDFKGETVEAIRVRPPRGQAPPPQPVAQELADDEIPF